MSEAESSHSDASFPSPAAATPASAGALLRAAREAQGLHIAALAVALKVPVKKLEALEADRFDLLPDMVFIRALAASVCRTLKVDPTPVLSSLPNTAAVQLNSKAAAMSVPFRAARDHLRSSFWEQLLKPWALLAWPLLLGMLVLVFVPMPQLSEFAGSSPPGAVVGGQGPVPPSVAEVTRAVPIVVPPVAADGGTPRMNSSIGTGQVSTAPSAVALPLAPNAAVPIAAAPGLAGDIVVFAARGVSWVEVVDATASVKLRRNLVSGDVVSASGVVPLSVVVGRADVVDVQLRGKRFDLMPVAKDNVARFEVK